MKEQEDHGKWGAKRRKGDDYFCKNAFDATQSQERFEDLS